MGILANESLTKALWNEYIIFEVSRSGWRPLAGASKRWHMRLVTLGSRFPSQFPFASFSWHPAVGASATVYLVHSGQPSNLIPCR